GEVVAAGLKAGREGGGGLDDGHPGEASPQQGGLELLDLRVGGPDQRVLQAELDDLGAGQLRDAVGARAIGVHAPRGLEGEQVERGAGGVAGAARGGDRGGRGAGGGLGGRGGGGGRSRGGLEARGGGARGGD